MGEDKVEEYLGSIPWCYECDHPVKGEDWDEDYQMCNPCKDSYDNVES